jgi:hypothetical protein
MMRVSEERTAVLEAAQSGRPPGWACGAHDIDPETGKLIAPMEPMPTVRSPGDPGYDEIFALNASWWTRRSERPSWWTTELWGGTKGIVGTATYYATD